MLVVKEDHLESFGYCLYKFRFEHVKLPEERIGQHKIGEHLKGFDLANHYCQHYDWISHSLNVTDVRPVQMKHLQYLAHLQLQTLLVLHGISRGEGAHNIPLNLIANLF